ncbi:MAG: hypothetical protein KKF65_04585 [Nanoarchaeota archaeon]|nr:hypothetical protein [Nanoarchaeota archaeon]
MTTKHNSIQNRRYSNKSGLLGKLARAGVLAGTVAGSVVMPFAMPSSYINKAKADIIQVANIADRSDITSYTGVLDANVYNTGTSLGYDLGLDHDMDTSTNPENYASLIYAELPEPEEQGGETMPPLHAVDYNYSIETIPTDTYTMKLSFENEIGNNLYNIPNSVTLTNFNINHSNGVADYEYILSVNTDSQDDEYDFTTSGLLSEVFASEEKKLGEWTQDFRQGLDWRLGRTYGELTLTAITNQEYNPGDANHDKVVDLLDLGIVGDNWHGTDLNWEDGDFNNDNTVDLLDLGIVGDNWHRSYIESTGTSVPEPSTYTGLASLLLSGATFLGLKKKFKK